MKRTEHKEAEKFDISAVIRSIQYLDEVLKRGVVVGFYEDSRMEVEDADIVRALKNVNTHLAETSRMIEMLTRTIARSGARIPGSPSLQ